EAKARLIEKHQPRDVQRRLRGDEGGASSRDIRAVLFAGDHCLFLCVHPQARTASHIAATLTRRPPEATHASTRSTSRASGCAARCSRNHPKFTRRGLLLACGSGCTSPVSRCRRSKRLTVASPMPNSSAVSAYVPLRFERYASTTRRRRSIERS